MPVKLNNDQYLLWIKDPSISPYINDDKKNINDDKKKIIHNNRILISTYINDDYKEASIHNDKMSRKNILTDEALKNPLSFLKEIQRITFHNTSLREDIVKQINEYNLNKRPRLYTLNDKWKYAREEIINQNSVNIDYKETYFDENECKKWVSNHLLNPRNNEDIEQNSSIYIELLYTTIQYGIDITNIENNLKTSSSKSPMSSKSPKSPIKSKDKDTKNIIDGIRKRLKFMKENDELFLNHNIASFDKLLNIHDAVPAKKPKLKNSFNVSTSSSPKSLNSAEKRELRDNILITNEKEKEYYEYNRLKKLQKKLHKGTLTPDVDINVFSKFKTFLLTLDNKIGRYKWEGYHPLIDSIIQSNSEENKDNLLFMEYLKGFYEMYNLELKDNITDTVRKFIYNIYEQIINNPRYQISSVSECFSYVNKSAKRFDNYLIINKIKNALYEYVDNYRPKLDIDIKKYFKFLVEDIIPQNYVFVLHTYRNGNGKDKRIKLYYDKDGYLNHYYIILFNNSILNINNIQYRLPEGEGFINGKSLMRKFVALNDPYFNSNIAEKIIVPDDDDLNDFTYEECKNWVILPIINPRTFEQISIDSPIYNRLLCMTYQYDFNLIPRMITSRGAHIQNALKKVLGKILIHSGKPSQTREQLEEYIIQKQFIKEKGIEFSKFIPDIIGLKWKDYGVSKPINGVDITENSKTLVEAMEKKIRKERIASRSSQDPVAFYVFFNKTEWDNFGITNIAKNSFIKVKAHYYIPVVAVDKIENVRLQPKKEKGRYKYSVNNRYNIVNCLKWVIQPNKNPITNELIHTDSHEYNVIFEQALILDSNIQPIDITRKGIAFKKKILKIKKAKFGISRVINKKEGIISPAKREEIINKNKICESINNIYIDDENDKKYLDFKEKMLKKCDKYLGEKYVCNLANIKKKLNDKFIKGNKKETEQFIYYEGSALCSVIAHYDMLYKYDYKAQNIFLNQYKKIFKVKIIEIVEIDGILQAIKKRPIDAGGVTREFFTKLFEELFCDEDNKNRPFILPEKNGETNRYYINPNFEPDKNFRKVIRYIKKNEIMIGNYNTEGEYEDIYSIIGKILGVVLVNEEIGLPKQFSTYILSRFINPEKKIDNYDLLYFYLRDFSNSSTYINMMNEQQKPIIDMCDFTFNDYYIISRTSESNPRGKLLTKDNYMNYMLQLSKHVVTKNFIFNNVKGFNKNMKGRYESLFNGFNNELRTILYNNGVSIDILDKLITNEQLDQEILLEFVEKMKISVIKYTADNDIHGLQRLVTTLTEAEKEVIINELRIYLTNIITNKRDTETDEAHYEFVRKLLLFWTGFSYYDKHAEIGEGGYKFFYMYGGDTRRFPIAHTCSYQFEFYGFPADIETEDKEAYLYEKIKYAVFGSAGMDLA
jgi:hypothetical protein